jgi:hypothetical protein
LSSLSVPFRCFSRKQHPRSRPFPTAFRWAIHRLKARGMTFPVPPFKHSRISC